MPTLMLKTPQEREQEQRKNIWPQRDGPKKSMLDGEKEIKLKVNPRAILKKTIFCLLLLSVFLVGRWSADSSDDSPSIVGLATSWLSSLMEKNEEVKPEVKVEEKPAEKIGEPPAAEPQPASDEEKESDDTPLTGAVTAETEGAPEPVVTSYTKVAIAITDVKVNWMETWGRITDITYTIKNNEEGGSIKPKYIIMTVEGYQDDERKINLPVSQQIVKSGQSITGTIKVSPAFSYSKVNAGDLTNVRVTGILFDIYDRSMASYSSDFNLQR